MVDYADPRAAKRALEQEAYRHYEALTGTPLARHADGRFRSQGHNDALDAFRHAYTSGRVTQIALGQQWVARHFGDDAEIGPAHPNDPYEHRMDLWNNEVGRRLGDEAQGGDALARAIAGKLQSGELVTAISDPRLRRIFPEDSRLSLPPGHPDRELLASEDVDRINADIAVRLDRALEWFPAEHPDRVYFNALSSRLPAGTTDAKVAEVLVVSKQAGIDTVEQLGPVLTQDDRIWVTGTTPGFRARIDADSVPPPVQQSVHELEERSAHQAYGALVEEKRVPALQH